MKLIKIAQDTGFVALIRSDRAARAFVWSAWLIMLLVAIVVLVKLGRNVPLAEDWWLIHPLTGNEPNLIEWLWAQNNEHRIPFPRLILLALLKAAHGDFRAGMLFNIIALGALSFAMIQVARSLRNDRTRFADAFFPIALLHLGHWENLFWSWQLTQVVPVILTSIILLVLVSRPILTTSAPAFIVGISLMLLPLCGANGLIFVPFLGLWVGYCAVLQWRAAKTKGGRQWISLFLIGSAVVALCLMGFYFVGYERPSWTPPNPGLGPSLWAALQFLALSFGPVARSSWMLSVPVAVAIFLSGIVVAILGALCHKGLDRHRALGLLAFLGGLAMFILAIGWGRAAVIPIFGTWPARYALFAVPVLCTAFFIWELYGPAKLRPVIQGGLFLGMFLLIPFNTIHGFWWARWFLEGDKLLEQDLAAGTPLSTIAERHGNLLFPRSDLDRLTDMLQMLRQAGIAPFAQVRQTPLHPDSSTQTIKPTAVAQPLVTQEIRYHTSTAGEVILVWGIEGWNVVPEEIRPDGTKLKNKLMHTPMLQENDVFVAQVQTPVGVAIDYGFLVTRKRDGTEIKAQWDGDPNYRVVVSEDGVIQVKTAIALPQDQPLVSQEVWYHLPQAGEVFLIWGIDGWQPVPAAIRPDGTEIKNKLMRTPMHQEEDTFIARIQVPVGAKIDYGFSITKKGNDTLRKSVWDGAEAYQTIATEDDRIEVISKLTLEQAQTVEPVGEPALVTQEIRYHMPEAGEVFLIWGIDGWQPLPESLRPAGTEIKNKLMRTLMHQEGDTFVVRTQVPIGVTINYGFMITDKRGIFDAVSHVWDGGQDYQTIASASGVVEVKPQLTLNNEWSNILDISLYLLVGVGILLAVWLAMFLVPGFLGRQTIRRWLLPCFLALSLWSIFLWPASVLADSPLATQEIRYNLPEAGEIFLVWGINGWNVLPKEMWPAGTILKDNLMYTPMVREDETFVARVRVPSGATIDYVFQITKTAGGASIEVWDANGNPKQDYHTAAVQDGSVAIQAMPVIQDQLRASSSASADVTQEIRYHLPIAGEVFFVWGINGWQMTPEETRPSGTVIKNEVMHTPMTREADFFVARIQTPARAMIDYGFLITKKRNGDAIKAVWDGEQDYRMTATEDGIVEVKPELSLLRDQISANVVNVNRQWRGVLLLIIGFVLAFGAGFIRRYPPLNHVVSPYLNYLNNDISKLIMFAIASRLLLLSIAYLSQVSIANLNEDYVTFKATYLEQVISPFGRGDVWWYMDIAQNGYEHRPFSTEKHANWAFYPLWPIVLKLGSFFIPDMLISGLILSNIFFLLSLIFLYQLISIDFDRNIAMLTSFLVIIFPASHFLSRPGPEALFLFLVVATLLCAKKNQWLLTGIIGSLAVLSRLQGLLLVLPLLFIYYKHYRVSQKHDIRVLSLLMIPAALLLLMFYMYWLTGNILANFAIQEAWDHHLSYPFAAMIQFLAKPDVINYYGWSLSPVNFIFLFFALVLTGFMIKKPEIPREYLIYTLLSIYLIIARDSLQASLRFMIPVFPLYLILSLLIYNKRTLSNFIFFSFISLQLFYFLAFVQEYNWAAT